ncbi:TolB family protein [Bacillus sp. FJAT-44742]|uniref:TolB family protein n=1 Tax=Bacillus sp. FJAT-44742 TaxID=2014005 RepID=UPI000C23C544|nr:PD40 domain-containing protein [Bacillus sp. FJAT-44742]
MKKQLWLYMALIISSCLFLVFFIFYLMEKEQPYQWFTGMGEDIAISSDDSAMAFSYYVDGCRSIYTADPSGTIQGKVTEDKCAQEHAPAFSSDGNYILYLAEGDPLVSSLFLYSKEDREVTRVTGNHLHVRDAVFSREGDIIYFIGIKAEDWLAEEHEDAGGFDLYSVNLENSELSKLTNRDDFLMNDLSISSDSSSLLFTAYEDMEETIFLHSLKESDQDTPSPLDNLPSGLYSPELSPDGEWFAYTTVTDLASEDIYTYELFLYNKESGQSQQLTDRGVNIDQPTFFNEDNRLAFLTQKNWPETPASYKLETINLDTGETSQIDLNTYEIIENNWSVTLILDQLVNDYTTGSLYLLMILFITYVLHQKNKRPIVAILVSAGLGLIIFAACYTAVYLYPWMSLSIFTVGVFLTLSAIFAGTAAIFLEKYKQPSLSK